MTVSAHDSDDGPGGQDAPGSQGNPGSQSAPGSQGAARGQDGQDGSYAVGVDFGTLSGRAVVVRVSDGAEVGSAVCTYRHAVMDAKLAATNTE